MSHSFNPTQRKDEYLSVEDTVIKTGEWLKQIYGNDENYNDILKMGQQIIDSLKSLHSTGYVHWNVSPSNI